MKRLICITIALCLVFGSILPVYAEAWTTYQATDVTNDVNTIKTYLLSFTQSWTTFFETMTGGTPSTLLTFQDLVRDVLAIGDWLAPIANYAAGLRPSGLLSIWDQLTTVMSNSISNASYNASSMSYLDNLKVGLTNYYLNKTNSDTWSNSELSLNWNRYMHDGSFANGYWLYKINADGSKGQTQYRWNYGSPLGNIAFILKENMTSLYNEFGYLNPSLLTHFNDNLTTWDSQGDTLQQVAFTPESAIQGLYRYLAFTQRDVARLTYVLASDEEIAAREEARENQTEVFDNFIDPSGSGSVDPASFGDLAEASGDIKTNFNTGVSASGIFDLFSGNHTSEWFSQDTADRLDQTQNNRTLLKKAGLSDDEYPTPLLDQQMNELLSLFGGDSE